MIYLLNQRETVSQLQFLLLCPQQSCGQEWDQQEKIKPNFLKTSTNVEIHLPESYLNGFNPQNEKANILLLIKNAFLDNIKTAVEFLRTVAKMAEDIQYYKKKRKALQHRYQ